MEIKIMTTLSDATYLQPHNKNLWEIFSMNDYFTDNNKDNFLVLDFGCNQCNFLTSAYRNTKQPRRFGPKNYIGLDSNLNSVNTAKEKYPLTANKILHYDKYHRSYNPTGIPGLLASNYINTKVDLVVAYSVFTHSSINETREILDDLKTLLKPGGSIVFSLWTSESLEGFYNYSSANRNIEKTSERHQELVAKPFNQVMYWIDHNYSLVDSNEVETGPVNSFSTFYKDVNAILNIFPDFEYLGKPSLPKQYQQLFKLSA
jgi:SAM-dependent methyltransferase